MFIYQAGPLTYYHRNNMMHKATEWRDQLDEWAKSNYIHAYNPAKTFLKERNHTYDDNIVVAQNNYYINKSDICVVCLDDVDYSPGTIFELTRFKELGKPVISFGKRHWSPHIKSCISHHCDGGVEEVMEVLCNMFEQGNNI
jgi:nucleoside 2-deoxyribosyltransferase